MEMFEFCLEVIKREGDKFNVGVDTSAAKEITAGTADEVNFDVAHNRCSFMYRCGTVNLSFAKNCFSKFMSEYENIVNLFFQWCFNRNLTLCSISKGPALDYLALLLVCYEKASYESLFKNINLITKYGAWRNTVNIMQEVVSQGYLKSLPSSISVGNIKVIQGDPIFKFCDKIKNPVSDSDVMLMMKTLNLQANDANNEHISKSLQNIFDALKTNALIFCVDTRPSISLITHELLKFPGKFLYEPVFMNTLINIELVEYYKSIFGCPPVLSARGSFFVWQKSPTVLSKADSDYFSMARQIELKKSLEDINLMHDTEHSNKSIDSGKINQIVQDYETSCVSSNINEACTSSNVQLRKEQLDFSKLENNYSFNELGEIKTQSSSSFLSKTNVDYLSMQDFDSNKTSLNAYDDENSGESRSEIKKIKYLQTVEFLENPYNPFRDSLKTEFSIFNLTNGMESNATILNENITSDYCSLNDKSSQTGTDFLGKTELDMENCAKIAALKNQIVKLTNTLHELLKINQVQKVDEEKKSFGSSEEICNHFEHRSIHDDCPHFVPCMHNCSCNYLCMSAACFICKCCGKRYSKNLCSNTGHRMSCTHQNHHCFASCDEHQTAKYHCQDFERNFNQNITISCEGPNLVIPLDKLETGTLSQIISLISKRAS